MTATTTRDPMPTAWRQCEICGVEGYDVKPSLALVQLAGAKRIFDTVTRCRDARACRSRCEAAGNIWPLL
jgi:hypothetical protein